MFVLHERLLRGSAAIGDLPLCRVLLLNDRRFAWLLLARRAAPRLRRGAGLQPATWLSASASVHSSPTSSGF
jgi:hypothetical protein